MRMRGAIIASIASVLAGCAGSAALMSIDGEADGVVYHLPRTVLEITVRQYQDDGSGRTWYTIGGPSTEADTKPFTSDLPGANEIKDHDVPDPAQRYVIRYDPSRLSDDRLCISRAPNGLLHDVQFAADDRTPQIVFNVARFVGGFVGSPAAFHAGPATDPTTHKMRSYTGRVDPYNDADIRAFNNALAHTFGAAAGLKLDFKKLREISTRTANSKPEPCTAEGGCPPLQWPKRCDAEHICYRSKLKMPVGLNAHGQRVDVKYASVVSPWDVGAISVSRAFLVQKITKLRFEKGSLVSAMIRKPSEVEEVTLMPLNVMNAILSVPTGLWAGAFADNQFKNTTIETLTTHNQKLAELEKIDESKLLLHGGDPVTGAVAADNTPYTLNCASGGRSNMINWFDPKSANQ